MLDATTMNKAYQFCCTSEGRAIILSGFRGAGIQEAVNRAREDVDHLSDLVDPFTAMTL